MRRFSKPANDESLTVKFDTANAVSDKALQETSQTADKRRDLKLRSESVKTEKLTSLSPLSKGMDRVIGHVVKGKRKATPNMKSDPILPSNQLKGKSTLAQLLNPPPKKSESKSRTPGKGGGDPSSSSDSSSDESDSKSENEDPDSSDSSSSTSSENKSSEDNQKKGSNKKKSRKRTQKSTLKPDPPDKYLGAANIREFVTFMEDATDYVRKGGVKKRLRIRKIARFLTGNAKEWYLSRVSVSVGKWGLRKFFTALYNHVFPLMFRQEQRAKLAAAVQGGQTV